MKRPSFQFYPADWRNNAKLRRCSWEARGVWLEVMGLMHDGDPYGVLRWSLKEISQALGAPMKALKELVDKGVMHGVEKGLCEPMIYTPVSGRKSGDPVELIAAQDGPIWYSPRMVRDEYVRTVRGASSRFGGDKGGPPNLSPKVGLGAGEGEGKSGEPKPQPSARQSDGSTSTSSSSLKNTYVNARDRFEMFPAWGPDEVTLRPYLQSHGVDASAITPELIASFVQYWTPRGYIDSHGGWCCALAKRAAQLRDKPKLAPTLPPHEVRPSQQGAQLEHTRQDADRLVEHYGLSGKGLAARDVLLAKFNLSRGTHDG